MSLKVMRSIRDSILEESRRSSFLSDPPVNFSVEAALAEERKGLSYDDRLQIEEELHGVGCRASNETSDLIALSLAVFDDQVNTRKETDPSCAHLLRNVIRCWPSPEANGAAPNHCYLNETATRLRFLRSERFIVAKAVQRFIDFLDFMTELFGDFVAERPVQISDFDKEEEALLMQSRNQFLPFRDRSGRRILAGVGNCNFHMDVVLRYKIFMYLFWVVSEDVETQIKGVVILCWAFDEANDKTWENVIRPGIKKNTKYYHKRQNDALPVRIASWQHYYRDTPYFRLLAALYVYTVVKNSPYHSIYRVNFGTDTELRYKLAGFGVPVELLPMSSTGTLKFENHRDWLHVIQAKMSRRGAYDEEIVDCPRLNDVVHRKGPASKLNPGNAYYQELINDSSLAHFTGDRHKKYEITMHVIEQVHSRGGRFLEWRNMWVVYKDLEKVRKKVASAFKQINRNRKHEEKQQLVKAISNATAIDVDEGSSRSLSAPAPKEPFRSRSTAATETNAESPNHRANTSMEYAFVDNPAKRLRTTQINDDDSACFGMCFYPTDSSSEEE